MIKKATKPDNLRKLIAAIENPEAPFTMDAVRFDNCSALEVEEGALFIPDDGKIGECGTPACIRGWCEDLFNTPSISKAIGVSNSEGSRLYWGGFSRSYAHATRAETVAHLKTLLPDEEAAA